MACDDDGFTLIELLIVVGIVGIIAAIAVPGLLRARMSADEASAIATLRAINSGQATYASTCAHANYAVSLVDLTRPAAGSNFGFLSPDLSSDPAVKSGYVIALAVGEIGVPTVPVANLCNGSTHAATPSYFVEAHPAQQGTTGQRSFGTDQRQTIFVDLSGTTWTSAAVAAATQSQAAQ